MKTNIGLQYIMDGSGNYYMVNDANQLVVAKSWDQAGVFSIYDANQRIGGGMKAKYYHTIPVDDTQTTETARNDNDIIVDFFEAKSVQQDKEMTNVGKAIDLAHKQMIADETSEDDLFEYEVEKPDWNAFLSQYFRLVKHAKKSSGELAKQHSEVDKELCDLMHYIEFYDLTEEESLKAVELIKDARQRRREIKNEMTRVDYFHKTIGTSNFAVKVKECLDGMESLEERKYKPRKMASLFEGMEMRKTTREEGKDTEKNAFVKHNTEESREEKNMVYVETVFDGRKNDWLAFAEKQREFFDNAEQYMTNLQFAIEQSDLEIEELMSQVEDANYNVAQGYQVFKKLKTMRNERKEKLAELEMLRTLTGSFDMKSMAEAYACNVEEIRKTLSL